MGREGSSVPFSYLEALHQSGYSGSIFGRVARFVVGGFPTNSGSRSMSVGRVLEIKPFWWLLVDPDRIVFRQALFARST
jgi:hypothetical protein